MADGSTRSIEAIRPGEKVRCVSEANPEGKAEARTVVEVYHNRPREVLEVRVGDELVRTTANHPFHVRGRGWTPAGDLRPGDELRTHEGTWLTMTALSDPGPVEPVYNLQVEDGHTYFVGTRRRQQFVLVHNQSPSELRKQALDLLAPKVPEAPTNEMHGCVPRVWAQNTPAQFTGEFLGLNQQTNVVTFWNDGTHKKWTTPLAGLSQPDRVFVEGLVRMPRNVSIDSHSLGGLAARQAWENLVVRDFSMLYVLGEGKVILAGLNGDLRVKVRIVPRAAGAGSDNKASATGNNVRLPYNPLDTNGAQTIGGGSRYRPPFLSLGTELFNATTAPGATGGPFNPREELQAFPVSEALRKQYNATLTNQTTEDFLWNKYGQDISTGGWGTQEVVVKLKGFR
jgi:hypothetical protein